MSYTILKNFEKILHRKKKLEILDLSVFKNEDRKKVSLVFT